MSFTKHGIANLQYLSENMRAKPGENLKSLPKKRSGKGSCTKSPYRDPKGVAESKILRKREQRLGWRRNGQAAVMNGQHQPPEGSYRRPGSMKK